VTDPNGPLADNSGNAMAKSFVILSLSVLARGSLCRTRTQPVTFVNGLTLVDDHNTVNILSLGIETRDIVHFGTRDRVHGF